MPKLTEKQKKLSNQIDNSKLKGHKDIRFLWGELYQQIKNKTCKWECKITQDG